MNAFTRIDPNHPLTQSARFVNDFANEHGLEATIDEIGMGVTTSELAYLAEQRAYRAVAARLGLDLGANSPIQDEMAVIAIVNSPLWETMSKTLIACYMDGMVIGWQGHAISRASAEADPPTA